MPVLQDLQKSLSNANSAYNAAVAALKSAEADAQAKHNSLSNCRCGKGKEVGKCRPLENLVSFGQKTSITECHQPIWADKCISDCCKKETCEDRVNSYNNAIDALSTARTNLTLSQQQLQTAQTALDNFIKTDPDAQEQLSSSRNIKIGLFFGGLVVVIIAFAWAYKKFVK